jgi:hypothetical protein
MEKSAKMPRYPPSKPQKSSQLTTKPAAAAAVVAIILFGLDSENINNCRTPQAIINKTDFGRGALKLAISFEHSRSDLKILNL